MFIYLKEGDISMVIGMLCAMLVMLKVVIEEDQS